MLKDYIFTSESVTEGHPDKIADQISDSILDALLTQDPNSRVACETLITTGLIQLAGEITTNAQIDYHEIARETVRKIGYDHSDKGFDANIFTQITDYTQSIALIPTAGTSGEGVSEVLMLLSGLSQKYLTDKLEINKNSEGKGSILEIKEETGIAGVNLWLCGVITIDADKNTGIGLYILRGECCKCEAIDSQEGTPKWVPWKDIHKYPLVEDLQVILPRIIEMKPGEPPFSAHYSYDSQDMLQITFG